MLFEKIRKIKKMLTLNSYIDDSGVVKKRDMRGIIAIALCLLVSAFLIVLGVLAIIY